MFKWRAGGLFVVHIPYRGTGLVITDLVAGQIAYLMDSIVSAQPHIADGKVVTNGGRVLCVTALGESTRTAHQAAYDFLSPIGFEGAQYRTDIGHRAIKPR